MELGYDDIEREKRNIGRERVFYESKVEKNVLGSHDSGSGSSFLPAGCICCR